MINISIFKGGQRYLLSTEEIQKSTCTQHNQCKPGQSCINGTCISNGTCTKDDQCIDGQVCLNGTCSNGTCTEDDQCHGNGYYCNLDTNQCELQFMHSGWVLVIVAIIILLAVGVGCCVLICWCECFYLFCKG